MCETQSKQPPSICLKCQMVKIGDKKNEVGIAITYIYSQQFIYDFSPSLDMHNWKLLA